MWLAAVAAIIVVAGIFAFKLYRHYTDDDGAQPGIIFERSDRPARV
jgi:hypothetical protein